MLLPNQRAAIETYLTSGTQLPADLSGALSAALAESESTCQALRLQLSQHRSENTKLLNERDRTVQLNTELEWAKQQLEIEVEKRVNLRTQSMTEELTKLRRQSRDRDNFWEEETTLRDQEEARLRSSNVELRNLLDKFADLVREHSSAKLLRRLFLKKTAGKCLQEFDAFELKERARRYASTGSRPSPHCEKENPPSGPAAS